MIPSRYVQNEEDILSKSLESYTAINQLMGDVLSYLLQNIMNTKGRGEKS
jgi:hypothetical protein